MFEFLRSLSEQEVFTANVPIYNGTNGTVSPTGTGTLAANLDQNSDVAFKNARVAINTDKDVTASDVTSYLDDAKKVNDGVECVGFAVELDDGQLVKMYVNKEDAEKFENELAAALGNEEEFEDAILRFSDVYDIVDVIWPDNSYGTQTADVVTAVDTQPSDQSATPTTTPSDPSELQSKISQDAEPTENGAEEPPVDPENTEPPTDGDTPPESNPDGSSDDADAAMDAFNKSFEDEADPEAVSTDGEVTDGGDQEPPKRSHHKKEESDETSGEGEGEGGTSAEGESSGEEPKRSHHKKEPEEGEEGEDDDDVSVIIHPKKKKVTESVEDDKASTATSSLFQVMGLDSQFSIVGAKLESLTAKRILAILGFIGIPGSMLVKIPNLEDGINEHGQTISADALTRTNFTKIFHSIIETQKSEKFTDVEYRTQFTKFLSLLGIDLSAIKSSRQAVSAVLFGAYCISSNPEAKIAFHAFMDNFESTAEQPTAEPPPVNESLDYEEDEYRSYDEFAHLMRTSGSNYRTWMPVREQRELANWFCSGSDVHVIFVPHDDDVKSHIPSGCSLYAKSSKPDEHGEIEVICLEKPTQVIRY